MNNIMGFKCSNGSLVFNLDKKSVKVDGNELAIRCDLMKDLHSPRIGDREMAIKTLAMLNSFTRE